VEALSRVAERIGDGMAAVAGTVAMLIIGWMFLKVVFAGGNDRALWAAVKGAAIVVVVVALLANLPAVAAVGLGLGASAVEAGLQVARESMASVGQ
jgi:hypothetical protein